MPSCLRAATAGLVLGLAIIAMLGHAATAGPLLLFDAGNGRVLYAEDQDHQWYPASLTKIMTAYVVFDAIKSGKLKLTDTVEVSEKAALQSPSKLGLPVGSEITVDLAIRALVVKSANDVAVMLAEKIGGSEEGFVERMNETARRLGLTRTHYVNANGLPVKDQLTTARDLARLSRAVLDDFPDQRALWALPEVRIGKQLLKSHNALLRSVEGGDGLKTGFICDAGFNIVASATRDGHRLLAVVLGDPTSRERDQRAASLLDHGFATADWKTMFGAPTLETLPVVGAEKPVESVRQSVAAWNCNGHRPGRKVVRRHAKPTTAAAAAHPAHAAPSPAKHRTAATRKSASPETTASTTAPGRP